jgi:hypothetical protein
MQLPDQSALSFTIALLVVSLLHCACAQEPAGRPARAPATQPATESFAVVELFTSEGCSSCPPADQALSDMVRDARAQGQRIFPLAFHVDYWDRLGWRDPFSDPAYSDRQRAYARALRLDSLYTPQMIVNGTSEFVGSDRQRAATETKAALNRPAAIPLSITVKPGVNRDMLTIAYTLIGDPARLTLNIAAVERGLETKVARGENANKTLRHENVVRAFHTLPLKAKEGQIDLTLPTGVLRQNASIIAYVQDASPHILGASSVDVPLK